MATPDRLEQYLQRVCRSLGGPRAMRDHVRQELREHLLDAAAEHRAAGLSEEAALEKALTEFGEPDAVRSELEATHGHRALAVVIDKAMGWKEKTMKARWLWSTWTHITVVAIVVLEILFCWFAVTNILPKMKKLRQDGLLMSQELAGPLVNWLYEFLFQTVPDTLEHVTWWMFVGLLGLWALFEWRFKGENKSYIRLSVLGTFGVGLNVLVFLMAGAMIVIFTMAMPGLERPLVPPGVARLVSSIEENVSQVQASTARQDWTNAERLVLEAFQSQCILGEGARLAMLVRPNEGPSKEYLQTASAAARGALVKAHRAVEEKDVKQLEKALEDWRKAFEPIRKQAKREEK